jgi:hypothetical protein
MIKKNAEKFSQLLEKDFFIGNFETEFGIVKRQYV